MIIIGAKGFAREVLAELPKTYYNELLFFDGVSHDLGDMLFDRFKIMKNIEALKEDRFILGLGGPDNREKLYNMFAMKGFTPFSFISERATIGVFDNHISEKACTIMAGVIITSNVHVGRGVLINLNCTIAHDVRIGDFSEVCPGVNISGHVSIGDNVFIGTGSVIIPHVKIGNGAVIAAGSVVTKDVPPRVMVAGVPALIKKEL